MKFEQHHWFIVAFVVFVFVVLFQVKASHSDMTSVTIDDSMMGLQLASNAWA
jgi:hypothetical protein